MLKNKNKKMEEKKMIKVIKVEYEKRKKLYYSTNNVEEKAKTLVQHLLDNNDGSDVHAFEFMDMKELGFKLNEAKGVFGSIVDKGLLEHDPERSRDRKESCGEDVELYQWTYPVDYEQHGNTNYEIKTTAEYLTAFENKMTSEKIEKLEKENQ
jgi:hypothetical protein